MFEHVFFYNQGDHGSKRKRLQPKSLQPSIFSYLINSSMIAFIWSSVIAPTLFCAILPFLSMKIDTGIEVIL
jgi:hypothetical protein